MNFLTYKLLNTEEIKGLKANLERDNLPWEDGKKTAGNHASLVKMYMLMLSKVVFLDFALLQNSIYGYFKSIFIARPNKENFYTSICIIFYIKYELFNS